MFAFRFLCYRVFVSHLCIALDLGTRIRTHALRKHVAVLRYVSVCLLGITCILSGTTTGYA